jgi:arylsulfatase A-like enzyme
MTGGKSGEYLTDRLTDEAIRFIETHRDRPFFLHLSHFAVHTPIQAPKPLVNKYRQKLKRDTSQKNATYAAMIDSVDQNVGRLLETLDRLKLVEDTLVIFVSDNGGLSDVTNNAPLREGKQTLYEGGIRVPLIVRWPGKFKPNATDDTPVHSDDLFPTILDAVAAKPIPNVPLDGQSLKPLLTQTGKLPRRNLYWYYPLYARRPGAVVRDGDYKLIEHYDPPQIELFNVADDLSETKNLAPQMPDRVNAMHADLDNWLSAVNAIRHTPNPDHQPKKKSEPSS